MSIFRPDVLEHFAAGGRSPFRLAAAEVRILLLGSAVWVVALLSGAPAPRSEGRPLWGSTLLERFSELSLRGGEGGALLPGLVFGVDGGLPATASEALLASSLSHLTAVSGANCAIWAAAVGTALRVRWLGWRWRILGQVGAVWGFATLVGLPPTVLRAGALLTVVAGVRLLGRGTHPLVSLTWGCLGVIVLSPGLVRSLSFQLSVAATAGIILLSEPIGIWLRHWLPRWLSEILAVTVAAQIACAPLLLGVGQVPTLGGVLANALAAPAVPLASVSGILALMMMWAPPVASVLMAPGCFCSWWILKLAQFFAVRPVGRLPWPSDMVGEVLAVMVCVAVVVLVQMGRHRRRQLGSLALGALLVVVVGTQLREMRTSLSFPTAAAVVFCDVGQGDAWFVRSGETVILVDVGPEAQTIDRCLREAGIRRITVLALTHFDQDHIGGIRGVLRRSRQIGELWLPGEADSRVSELVQRTRPVSVRILSRGEAGTVPGISWSVLWPSTPPQGEVGNEHSLVLLFSVQGLHVLGLGDTGSEEQRRMRISVPTVDVLKAGHHGSADHDPLLIGTAAPRLTVLSVGAGNSYGHPAPTLLRSLAGRAFVRTDRDGTVAVTAEGSVWCARGCHTLTVQ